jgi:hypothetical protein
MIAMIMPTTAKKKLAIEKKGLLNEDLINSEKDLINSEILIKFISPYL